MAKFAKVAGNQKSMFAVTSDLFTERAVHLNFLIFSRGWGLRTGLAPSRDYRNKLIFVPTQHPIFTPGPDNK